MAYADTLLLLHGVGEGDPDSTWIKMLNRGLERHGYPVLAEVKVVAPQYADLLKDTGQNIPIPRMRVKPLKGRSAKRQRREFHRRQTAVERLLKPKLAPEWPWVHPTAADVTVPVVTKLLKQADNYLNSENVRGAVLNEVIDQLAGSKRIVIVGHSLGSVIAADLIQRLSPDQRVSALVTMGSPLVHPTFSPSEFMKSPEVPPENLDWWVNFRRLMDPVPAGRNLAYLIPWILDRVLPANNPLHAHGAPSYLEHPDVTMAIGYGLFGSRSKDLVARLTAPDVPLDQPEGFIFTALRFAHLLHSELEDGERKDRYGEALRLVQADAIERIVSVRNADGRPVPHAVERLSVDLTDPLTTAPEPYLGPTEDPEALIPLLVAILQMNPLGEIEIDVPDDVQKLAARLLTFDMELGTRHGEDVFEALQEARDDLSGFNWRSGLAFGGAGALLAVSIVLPALAAPGAAGAAAITSALAAFGPGGMVGGLFSAGALTTAGGAGIVAGLTAPSTDASTVHAWVVSHLAVAFARRNLGYNQDPETVSTLMQALAEIERQLRLLEPLSDKSSPELKQVKEKHKLLQRALKALEEKKLLPGAPSEDFLLAIDQPLSSPQGAAPHQRPGELGA